MLKQNKIFIKLGIIIFVWELIIITINYFLQSLSGISIEKASAYSLFFIEPVAIVVFPLAIGYFFTKRHIRYFNSYSKYLLPSLLVVFIVKILIQAFSIIYLINHISHVDVFLILFFEVVFTFLFFFVGSLIFNKLRGIEINLAD